MKISFLKCLQVFLILINYLAVNQQINRYRLIQFTLSCTQETGCDIILMKVTLKQSNHNQQTKVFDQSKTNLKPTFFQMKSYQPDGIFQELAFMLIRPPRFIYNPDILIPSKKLRERFVMQNYSIPFELTLYRQANMKYVILYMHGNGSSRFQGFLSLKSLPDHVGLACFDFAGCGNRFDRDFITLGQQQSKQVDIAALFLKEKGFKVVGWGRSMGAASLLMSSECDLLVSDSAYSNLATLCKQQSSKFLPKICCCIFHCVFPCVFGCIRCKVHSLSHLQIQQMDVAGHLRKLSKLGAKRQICFIHGQDDTLIPCSHAQALYNSYEGRKMLIYFSGTHNSTRPAEVINRCFQFIDEAISNSQSEVHPSSFPQNPKISKMVELQQLNAKSFFKQGRQTDQKSELVMVSPSKMELRHSEAEHKQDTFESGKREEAVRVHTEYNNGKSLNRIKYPEKEESFCEAGDKLNITQQICDKIQRDYSCQVAGSEAMQSYHQELRSEIYKEANPRVNENMETEDMHQPIIGKALKTQ